MEQVVLYTTRYCPFCIGAKEFLQDRNIPFKEIPVDNDQELRDEVSSKYNWRTVPMIILGDQFIGGFDELKRLAEEGKLP